LKKPLFLICNAHLDPVWLWEWEEGLAETLSTFRAVAEMTDEFEGFAFCHNEAVLYQWVEEYDPELFSRIQQFVAQGRWNIIGGWYLQPDCNLPAGESFVRQISAGKNFFRQKFGVEPRTAVNFDSFGHSRGLVQILKKSGYTSYLFCRPQRTFLELPADDFRWVGCDGSEILAHRASDHYNTQMGQAVEKIQKWFADHPHRDFGLLLWGIGDHGGGPSRGDLRGIERLRASSPDWDVLHAAPEDYFYRLYERHAELPRWEKGLNPWSVGCYTSMIRVKQGNRRLESLLYMTEKMLTQAALKGLMTYPAEALREAERDMMFCQFHDILPGSSIAEVEAFALQRQAHGAEILSRLKARAFFALTDGQSAPQEGDFPLLVYNPHPSSVETTVVCEFQPLEPNLASDTTFWLPELFDQNGGRVPFQLEKESCNILDDQRKRLVFRANLQPAQMNRFNCRLRVIPLAEKPRQVDFPPQYDFHGDELTVRINPSSGLMDEYAVKGTTFLLPNAFRPMVMQDDADPWGMRVRSFREAAGEFQLMTPAEAAEFAGVNRPELPPIRIIEDGAIRTTVEALLQFNHSRMCLRYKIPRRGSEVEVELRVYWQEKDRLLKLSLPTPFRDGACWGEIPYGVESCDRPGEELVMQRWAGVASADGQRMLTVVNDGIHGWDFSAGELRLTMLRSPAYSGHPITGNEHILRQDRFEPRLDQGERCFRFWLNAGEGRIRRERIDLEAVLHHETPMALCAWSMDSKHPILPGIMLSNPTVRLAALKMAESEPWVIIRLFETTGAARTTKVNLPTLNMSFTITLKSFELKTIAVDLLQREWFETDLLERRVK